jgi:signal transduction histidine kinase
MQIIHNSSLHLQNVIEDALDLSRIENNKFEMDLQFFDIRKVVEGVVSIMNFQVISKNLYLKTDIDDRIPNMIKTD